MPFTAGQKLTADALNQLLPTIAAKATDQTVNNSSTLVDDDDMVIALAANSVYRFEAVFVYNSNTTADIKIGYTIPSGASTTAVTDYFDTALTRNMIPHVAAPTTGTPMGGNASNAPAWTKGTVTTTTAGNLTIRWAQNTTNASNTVMKAGSFLAVQIVT